MSWTDPGNSFITRWEYEQTDESGPGDWMKIDDSGASTTSHTVERLRNGVRYSFKVRAAIGNQLGTVSASVSATPQKAPCQPWLDAIPAGVGPDFTADVTIRTSCGNITGMEYQIKDASAGWPSSWQTLSTESIRNNESLSQEFDFSFRFSPSVGGPHDFRIRALNSGVAGEAENPRRIVWAGPPSAPQGLRAQPGAGSVNLTWNLASTQQAVTGWAWQSKLATASNYGGWDTVSGANASATSHTVENLTSGTAYKFRVRAINAAGDGAVSSEVTATPLGVTVSKSSLTVPEGGSGTYTVKLDAAPAEDVTVTITGASGDVTVDPASLTFTPRNYGAAQTVTVSAAEDDDAVTEALVTLTHGAQGGGLDRVAIPSVEVTVTENDTAGVTVSVSELTIAEGGSGEYTLVLDSEPSDDVTVSVLADGDLGDVRAIPSQLTFTPADWRTEQTVTVSAAEDGDAKTDPAVTLIHRAEGGDYDGVRISSVTVNVTEDDPPLKPTNIVETPGDGQVTLTWENPRNPDITHWEIQQQARVSRNPAWTPWKRIAGSGAATARHVVTKLNNGTFYAFRIRAVSAAGDGAESDDVITLPTRSGKHITLAPDGARITEGNDGTKRVSIDIILGEPAPAASGEGVSLGGSGGLAVVFKFGSASTAKQSPVTRGGTSCTTPNPTDADMCWPVSPLVIIDAGQSNGRFEIAILGDRTIEPDETIVLKATPTADGWTGDSMTLTIVNDEVPPAAPTGFSATAGNAQVTLSWDNPNDASITRWEVQQRTGGSGPFGRWLPIAGSGPATTSHVVTNLTNGAAYAFKVRAVNDIGAGAASSAQAATPLPLPAAPTGVRMTADNEGLTLSWDDPGDAGITRWEVQLRRGGRDFGRWLPIPRNDPDTDFSVPGRVAIGVFGSYGVVHAFRVRAVNSAGPGPVSAVASLTPLPPLPAQPTGLSATRGQRAGDARLDRPGERQNHRLGIPAEDGRRRLFGPWLPISGSSASTTRHVVTNLNNGVAYAFKVRAVNIAGPGPASAEATATLQSLAPAAPTGFSAFGSNRKVTLLWNNPDNPSITRWEVQQKTGSTGSYGGWNPISSSSASTTRHVVTNLVNGTPYAFKVRAVNTAGNGAESPEQTATPAAVPDRPTGFRAQPDFGSVILTWDNPSDAAITAWGVRYGPAERELQDSDWKTIQGSNASTTRHVVRPLAPGFAFRFQIRAVRGRALGPASAELRVTVPQRGVTVSTPLLKVDEGGTGSYTLTLETAPLGNFVEIEVAVFPESDVVRVSPTVLGFTSANWTRPQTVMVTAAADEDAVADPDVTLTHTPAGGGYDEVAIDSVTVAVTETTPILQLLTDPDPVAEGTAISLTVTSDKARTGRLPVSLTLSARGASGIDANDIPDGLDPRSFNAEFGQNASRTGTVTIPTSADTNVEGVETYTVTLNDAAGYAVGSDVTANGTLSDPIPEPDVPTNLMLTVGDGEVKLTWNDPEDASIIRWEVQRKDGSNDWGGWTNIALTDLDTSVSGKLSWTAQNLKNGTEYRFRLRARNVGGAGGSLVTREVTPKKPPFVGTVTVEPTKLTIAEGSSGSYTMALDNQPPGDVTISIGLTASTLTLVNPDPSNTNLTFTPADWDTPQTVTMIAPKDANAVNEADTTILHAVTAGDYDTVIDNVTVSVTDTTPILQLLTNPLTVTEGTDISLEVTSDKAQTGTLSVNLTLAAQGAAGFTADDISGTLGPRNFDAVFGATPSLTGTVTIPTSSDSTNESAETYRITLNDTDDYELGADKTADGTLNDGGSKPVSVPATVTVTEGMDSNATVQITTTEAFGEAVTFNVSYGSTSATSDVDAKGAGDPSAGDYDNDKATSVAFGASDTTKDIAVPITDDDLDESDETFTVTIAPAAALPTGFALGASVTTVTIKDDDASPVLTAIADVSYTVGQTVDITAAATDADGDSVSYKWSRKEGETTPALPDGTALNQAQLTFTTTAAGTYTMTVTANDGNGNTGNTDTEEVVITVTPAPISLSIADASASEDTGTLSFTVTASSAPSAEVTFNYTVTQETADTAVEDTDFTAVTTAASGPSRPTRRRPRSR